VKSIGVLVLAILLSAGSGAAVTKRLITSRDIKNGTIRSVDVSASARAELRGFKSVRQVKGPVTELHVGSEATATATCPAGTILVGGGYNTGDRSIVFSSRPAPSGNAWEATGKYTGSILLDVLYAYALCAAR
jgi:hypothetical protein